MSKETAGSGEAAGTCPICGRPLVPGPSVDRHHFLPKSRGGRESVLLHRVCHRKIHSLWTERQLERELATPEAIRAHPEMRAVLRWIARKPPEFWVRTRTARSKPGRRGR